MPLRLPLRDPLLPWSYQLRPQSLAQHQNVAGIKFVEIDANRLQVAVPLGNGRIEYDLDARYGDRIVAIRGFAANAKEPATVDEFQWKQVDDRWIATKAATEFVGKSKFVIEIKDFRLDADVEDQLFSPLESIPIPDGTRFIDRRPNPQSKFLWKVGTELTPVRPDLRLSTTNLE